MSFRNSCSKREAWHPGRNCPPSKHATLPCELRDSQFIRSDLETAVVKGREINAARGEWDSPGWWFPGGLGWLCSSARHRRRWLWRRRWRGRGGTTSWRIGGCWTSPWPWEGAEEADQLVNLVEGFCLPSARSPNGFAFFPTPPPPAAAAAPPQSAGSLTNSTAVSPRGRTIGSSLQHRWGQNLTHLPQDQRRGDFGCEPYLSDPNWFFEGARAKYYNTATVSNSLNLSASWSLVLIYVVRVLMMFSALCISSFQPTHKTSVLLQRRWYQHQRRSGDGCEPYLSDPIWFFEGVRAKY